ncbi:MAG: hypothetical protein J6T22_04565 [Bacteroidales bacterium]|nr:hypothetical protein [Bacteroidales bacterium]
MAKELSEMSLGELWELFPIFLVEHNLNIIGMPIPMQRPLSSENGLMLQKWNNLDATEATISPFSLSLRPKKHNFNP